MSCTLYKHQDIFDLGPKIITGVICGGGPQIQYTLNFGDSVCLDDDFAIIICDNIAIIGSCNFGPTPTPTNTSTIAATPTTTATPTRTIALTPSNTQTQTNTPSITATQTPSSTIGSTPTQTPSQTMTRTPTMTPTSTGCTNSNNCMEITVTGTSEEFFASIEYNNCFGTLINEVFTTNGTRYRCIQFVMGVEQIFSYTGIIPPTIFGGNCNTFNCPTGVIPLTPSPTPTMTSTPTPSVTIGSTPTQTPSPSATLNVTPTITSTPSETPPASECICYCYTYETVPNDLYVRYALCGTSSVETELIQSLPFLDNGDGTYTACICVKQGGAYQTPVCVQGGLEILCPNRSWSAGSNCTTYSTCFLG